MQLKLHDVATIFEVSENVVHRWIRENNLPVQIANTQYRFNRAELVEWATLNHITIPPKLLRLSNGDLLSNEFASSLELGGIHANIPGEDQATVLRNIVTKLPEISAADQENLAELLLSRERMGTTAIGDGIAIPHPGCPVAIASEQSISALCYLEQPLDFHAPDNKPVHALFVLLTPTVRRHSLVIAELASALQDKEFRAAVQRRASEAEILTHARRIARKEGPGRAATEQLSNSAAD